MSVTKKPKDSHAAYGEKLPTGFRGTCGMVNPSAPKRSITREERDLLDPIQRLDFPSMDYGTKLYNGPGRCDFTTDSEGLFDVHMAGAHGAKLGQIRNPDKQGAWEYFNPAAKDRLTVKLWRGPRLTEDGTDWQPKPLEPGDRITWTEYNAENRLERTGQVWSKAAYPKSVWVVADEPLVEGEIAVCVIDRGRGGRQRLEHHETWKTNKVWSSPAFARGVA